jgi:hypothetical protein
MMVLVGQKATTVSDDPEECAGVASMVFFPCHLVNVFFICFQKQCAALSFWLVLIIQCRYF